jgi:hypothetical protein
MKLKRLFRLIHIPCGTYIDAILRFSDRGRASSIKESLSVQGHIRPYTLAIPVVFRLRAESIEANCAIVLHMRIIKLPHLHVKMKLLIKYGMVIVWLNNLTNGLISLSIA